MMTGHMAGGVLLDILSALVVAWFLARSTAMTSSYFSRVVYCGMFGVFVAVFTHLMNWNWMGFPMDFTSGLIIDGIVGLLLAGLGIAAIVNRQKRRKHIVLNGRFLLIESPLFFHLKNE